MNIVNTTAPIAIDELKKYFADKQTFFVVDYKESDLKGQKLLTYLSNLDLPVDLINIDDELLADYFHSSTLVSVPALEEAAIDILFEHKGIVKNSKYSDFVKKNSEVLDAWKSKLDSLTLYNLYTVSSDELKEYAQSFPVSEMNSLEGINFISLIKHESFFEWFKTVNDDELVFYKNYFDEYMFKGQNLFHYWANENNPMFLLTNGIASGAVKGEEYFNAKQKSLEELDHVASI